MTVTNVTKNLDALTVTFACEFAATVEQVWRMWADPLLLERWWGPPSYPATVTDHDITPGGLVRYDMTGPDGHTYPGGFRFSTVKPFSLLEFEDYFEGEDGKPDPDMPVSATRVEITPRSDTTTQMVLISRTPSREAMDQLVEMGAVEGMSGALGQIDDLLPEAA